MTPPIPLREIYWNIPAHLWLYPLFAPFLAAFLYGCSRLIRLVRVGRSEPGTPSIGRHVRALLDQAVLQRRLLEQPFAGGMHAAISWGFGILFAATCLVALQDYFGVPTLRGSFYLYFMSLTVDLFGLAAAAGVMAALARRYGRRPARLWQPRDAEGYALFLWLLLLILLSGFLVEGLRIAATRDPWGAWSPGGWVAALPLTGLSHGRLLWWHRVAWWAHAVLAFAFIALAPYTMIRHILASPANLLVRQPRPSGVIQPVVLEEAEHFGASAIRDFLRRDLLDLLACTECGRCQDACPAWATGKPLTPKGVIVDLRDHLVAEKGRRPPGRAMVGEVVGEDAVWACTTCGACHRACPVLIEPIPKIIDMRRFLVMEEARFPGTMQAALRGLENRGHPYQGVVPSRTAWAKDLDLPLMGEQGSAEYLYWVGCAAAFDERVQKVARALVRVLRAAGVSFAVLGEEERCTGEVARRIGHEYLFQLQARANVETLNRYGVQKIVTACPHCFNTLKHEYPHFGGQYEVVHHSELIAALLRQGRLRLQRPLQKTAAYHDSCYLGRHNGIYGPPGRSCGLFPACGCARWSAIGRMGSAAARGAAWRGRRSGRAPG